MTTAEIISTGGLDPTVDDPTRDAAARAAGLFLEYRPELWEQVEALPDADAHAHDDPSPYTDPVVVAVANTNAEPNALANCQSRSWAVTAHASPPVPRPCSSPGPSWALAPSLLARSFRAKSPPTAERRCHI
jgi:hypothetical protein